MGQSLMLTVVCCWGLYWFGAFLVGFIGKSIFGEDSWPWWLTAYLPLPIPVAIFILNLRWWLTH